MRRRERRIAALVTNVLYRHGLTVETFSRSRRKGASEEIPKEKKMRVVQDIRGSMDMSARELSRFLNIHHSTISQLSKHKKND